MQSLKFTFLSFLSSFLFFPLCLFYAFYGMLTEIVNSYFSLNFSHIPRICHHILVAVVVVDILPRSSSRSSHVPKYAPHEQATLSGALKVRAKFIAKLVLNRRSRDRPRLRPRTLLFVPTLTSVITDAYVKKKKFSLSFLRLRKFPRVTKR